MPDVAAVYTVDVRTHVSPDGIRQALKEQLYKPVRWADTVRAMVASGVTTFVECGPGKVLTSLNRRIERGPNSRCSLSKTRLDRGRAGRLRRDP